MVRNKTQEFSGQVISKRAKNYTWAIAALAGAGLVALVARTLVAGGGLASGDSAWLLQWTIDFRASKPGVVLEVAPPWETAYARVYGQSLTHSGLRLQRLKVAQNSRAIVAVTKRAGAFTVTAEFNIHLSPRSRQSNVPRAAKLTADQRELFLRAEPSIPADSVEVESALAQLAGDADTAALTEAVYEYATRLRHDARGRIDDVVEVLRSRQGTALGRARAMTALCRAARIPARIVTGFLLEETYAAVPHHWVEVLEDGVWRPYDPRYGYAGDLPGKYVPVKRGGESVFSIDESASPQARYVITRASIPAAISSGIEKNVFDVLDLTRLPPDTRSALAVLLLLPVGALITTFARNVVGVRTYGTFSPTLLAMAAIYVDWLTAAVVVGVVTVIGIGGRALLPGLRLAHVPRLSIVFTLVAIGMVLGVSLMAYGDYVAAGLVVLLPIVILTNLVDRVYSVADEDGLRVALVRLAWTAVVGLVCFLVFLNGRLGDALVRYPELHLFTIALIVSIANYRGRRLSNLRMLHWLTEPAGRNPRTKAAARRAPVTEE